MTVTLAAVPRTARPAPDDRIHVVIADHDGFARSMMHNAVLDLEFVAMVTTAGDARTALELVQYYRPSVLVAETALPPKGGADLIGEVLEVSPRTRVLTVAVDDEDGALAALRAGAVGHVDKEIGPDGLAEMVARAADGEAIVPPRLVSRLLDLVREVPDAGWRPLHSRLTTREWEIIDLLASGVSTHHIAERLVLSPTTIYSHVKSLMRKLGVHSRREAVLAAQALRRAESMGRNSPTLCQPSSPNQLDCDGETETIKHRS